MKVRKKNDYSTSRPTGSRTTFTFFYLLPDANHFHPPRLPHDAHDELSSNGSCQPSGFETIMAMNVVFLLNPDQHVRESAGGRVQVYSG